MKIEVLRKEANELELEIDDLTLCELLRNELWQDSSIKVAAFERSHPNKNPILKVWSDGKTAKKALEDTIKRLDKQIEDVEKKFKAAVK